MKTKNNMKTKLWLLTSISLILFGLILGSYLAYRHIQSASIYKEQDAAMLDLYKSLIETTRGIYVCYLESMALEQPVPNYYHIKRKYRVLLNIRDNGLKVNEHFWGVQSFDSPKIFDFFQKNGSSFAGIYIVLIDDDIYEDNNEKRAFATAIKLDNSESSRMIQSLLEDTDLRNVSQNISSDTNNDGNQQIKK